MFEDFTTMKRPPIIIFIISGMLVLYGIQTILIAIEQNHVLSLNYIWAAGSFVAAAGLVLSKSWSQYLIYFFAATMSIQWVYVTWLINRSGWRYDDFTSNIVSLVPGILLLFVCICSSIVVFKYFKRRQET
jgi:hypothetical protein